MKKMLLLAFALSGCATIPKSDQVKVFAARDFRCDTNQVQTTQVDDKTMRVSGCGQEATYTEQCVTSGTTRCTWVANRSTGMPTNTAGTGTPTGGSQ